MKLLERFNIYYSRICKIICFILVIILCFIVLKKHQIPQNHPLTLVYFGDDFTDRRIKEFSNIQVPTTKKGYDGQFYIQHAMDPLLLKDETIQMYDNAPFRSKRLGLPLISWFLSMGQNEYIKIVYPLMNFIFLLLFTFLYINKYTKFQGIHLISYFIFIFSPQVTASIERALIDFPSIVLCFIGIISNKRFIKNTFYSLSILTKETQSLNILLLLLKGEYKLKIKLKDFFLVFMPPVLWWYYTSTVTHMYPFASPPRWGVPFGGIINRSIFLIGNSFSILSLYELVTIFSLFIQFIYLLKFKNKLNPIWLTSITALFIFIFSTIYLNEDLYNYRIYTGMTFAFALLIPEEVNNVYTKIMLFIAALPSAMYLILFF